MYRVQDVAPFMMIRVQKYAENPKIPNIFLFLDILVPKLNKIKAAKPRRLRRLSIFKPEESVG